MRFIHTGDFHIGATLSHASFSSSDHHARRVREIEDACYRLLDVVKKDKVEMLFITGDLFDHAQVQIAKIDRLFEALSELDTDVFIVIGNHDVFLHNAAYRHIRQMKNVHFFDKDEQKVALDKVDVYGFSTLGFDKSALLKLNATLDQSKRNVLCLHGDVFNEKDANFLMGEKELKALDFNYIALGHIHKHRVLAKHIVYSGNLEPLDFSETDVKGYIKGTLDNVLTTAFVPFSKRRFIVKKIALTVKDTIETLEQKVLDCVSDDEKTTDFIRVVLSGVVGQSFALSEAVLNQLKQDFYYLEVKDHTELDLDLKTLKEAYKDTIIEQVIDLKDGTTDPESVTLALRSLLATEEGKR